jgi:hypothetical protein
MASPNQSCARFGVGPIAAAAFCLVGCNSAPLDAIVPPSADLTDSLVAHWTLDEGSGVIAFDQTGNGHNGQLTGGTWVPDGRFAGGLRLAEDDSIAVPNFPAATFNWTVAAWIRMSQQQLDANEGIGTVLTTENFDSNGWALNVDRLSRQAGFVFSYWSASLDDYLHTECRCVENDVWVHLAAVVDMTANQVVLYVDGTVVDQRPRVSEILPGDSTLYFGRWNMNGRFLSGDLDDIAIWGRALVASEVLTLNSESPRRHSTP